MIREILRVTLFLAALGLTVRAADEFESLLSGRDPSQFGRIYPIDGARFEGKWDADAARKATRPLGEWNREEVASLDGELTCTLNAVVVTRGRGAFPSRGRIGWQSEGVPIRFRKLTIKPLD